MVSVARSAVSCRVLGVVVVGGLLLGVVAVEPRVDLAGAVPAGVVGWSGAVGVVGV